MSSDETVVDELEELVELDELVELLLDVLSVNKLDVLVKLVQSDWSCAVTDVMVIIILHPF